MPLDTDEARIKKCIEKVISSLDGLKTRIENINDTDYFDESVDYHLQNAMARVDAMESDLESAKENL